MDIQTIQPIMEIGIVGVGVSLTMKLIKKQLGTRGIESKLVVLALSLLAGTAIYLLSQTNYWVAILGVLASASSVYSMFLKK